MTRVTVDEELKRKLLDFSKEVELCDEHGQVLAHVKPVHDLSDFDAFASEEELDRRSKSSEKRYTTQAMLDYLERD